jgi:hypothetical protein
MVDRRGLVCLLLLGAGLVVALALTLSHAAPRRAGTNGIGPETPFSAVGAGRRVCQGGELLPAGTTSIRLIVPSQQRPGPQLAIELRRHRAVIARTTGATGGVTGFAVDAPIPRVARDLDGVTLCYTVGDAGGEVAVVGGYTPPGTGNVTIDGRSTGGSMPIEYMRPGSESWWSYASTVMRRIGLGRGDWGGAWMAWAAAALVLAALALAVRAVVRSVLVDAPIRAAVGWSVAEIGVMNALAWSLLTPVFQVPDEQSHVGYAQVLAESHRLPLDRGGSGLAPELSAAMTEVRFGYLGAPRKVPALWSPLQQAHLERVLHAGLPHRGNGDAGAVAPEPPLYYALEAVPYTLANGATLLDRVALMRVFSALLAGVTALLTFLFVRECLPARPWAWTVGGVGAAFVPLLGFVSGGVNPDALLFAICAGLFYALALAFRRGLTTRLAVWIGVVLALGAITKINFYGLVPGAIVAVVLAARMTEGAWNARVARLTATAVAVGVAPYALLMLLDALVWERTLILARTPSAIHEDHGGLGGQLSYLWQVYLPRLPGQTPAFPELKPTYDLWVSGFVGRFGWVTVEYPSWAYRMGEIVLITGGLLALRTLVVRRAAVRIRRLELLGYGLIAGGLFLLMGLVALRGFAPGIKGAVQGRYVLPLLALFAALLALAARGAGERWGRAAGVAIVMLTIAWSLFGQLLTIAYYYG